MPLLRTIPLIALFFGSLAPAIAAAQPATAPATQASLFDPARHMRIDEVKPGMKGYGLTVFQGQKIERFDVEVIDVQKNFNLREDVVLIRCLGDKLEHDGVIAGMSGSPIFLTDDKGRDRMIGALAYGWSMSKDPIAGVQPIEYMLDLNAKPKKAVPTTLPTTQVSSDTGLRRWRMDPAMAIPVSAAARPGVAEKQDLRPVLTPLATPLMVGGMSPEMFRQSAPLFTQMGLVPLQAGGVSAKPDQKNNTIVPGSPLVIPLVTGDLDISALGTCTEVLGKRIYGFGHPFQGEGNVSLPMAAGYVTTVIPMLTNSFKLGGPTQVVGTLNTDQSVGIAGEIGATPAMIPVDLNVVYADGSSNRTFHFNVVSHPQLTPILSTIVLSSGLASQKQLPQYNTVDIDLSLAFQNGKTITISNSAVNASETDLFTDVGMPIASAADNPFERVAVKKISGKMTVSTSARAATILDINIPRTRYLPGETIKAYVTYRPFRGSEAILPVEMKIPTDLPDGTYSLKLSDWENYLMEERQSEPFRFTAENVDQVFAVLQEIANVHRDALYVRLMRQADGVAVGRAAMSRLPASRRKVLLDAGRSNTTAFVSSTVKVIPSKYVFSGDATFEIEVDRNAHADRPHKREIEVKSSAGVKPTSAPSS